MIYNYLFFKFLKRSILCERRIMSTTKTLFVLKPTFSIVNDIIEKYYDDGSYYLGEFKNGMRNGQGTFIYQDGSRYEGEWKNDMRHGKGKFYFSNDTKQGHKLFYGDWKNDTIHGYGFLVLNNGKIHKGVWYDNKMIGVSE